jgi:hypothetical protein
MATGSIAVGTQAYASNGGAAFGDYSTASGEASTAVGPHATAAYSNSTALGNGAATTRDDQVALGTSSNTYTMAGVTSNASKQAQGKPGYLVTSNSAGDLAAYTPGQLGLASGGDVYKLQTQINSLGARDNELTEGIAAAASIAQPVILPGQHFAMRAGWGGYDGSNAFAFSAAGVLASNLVRPGIGTLALDGGVGVGTDEGEVVGRAGVSLGW